MFALALTSAAKMPPSVYRASHSKGTTYVQFDKLVGSAAMGGWLIERYLPVHWLIRGLASALVGMGSNYISWQTLVGPPRGPVLWAGLISAFASTQNFLPLKHPGISGCVTGSTLLTMYYASKYRGSIMKEEEALDARPFY